MADLTKNIPATHKTDLVNIQPAYKFTGKNYLTWSQVVKTYLKGKGKFHHLTSTSSPSDIEASSLTNTAEWEAADSMVMSWLWDSMDPSISINCMFLDTAKEIWEFMSRSYSKVKDEALTFDLTVRSYSTQMGERSITEYANILQSIWQELDQYQTLEMKCKEDAATLKQSVDKQRAYVFLAGLNSDFDAIRIQVLGRSDFPSLEEIIFLMRAEESRRGVMLASKPTENIALAAQVEKKDNRAALWCTHCNKPRHTKERCWKLHGKPPSREWGNKQPPPTQANLMEPSAATTSDASFSSADISRLQGLLRSLEKSAGNPSTNTLQPSGNAAILCFHSSYKSKPHSWILDSGATNHMTPLLSLFHTYSPCTSTKSL